MSSNSISDFLASQYVQVERYETHDREYDETDFQQHLYPHAPNETKAPAG